MGGLRVLPSLSEPFVSPPKQHLTCCRCTERILHVSDDIDGRGGGEGENACGRQLGLEGKPAFTLLGCLQQVLLAAS